MSQAASGAGVGATIVRDAKQGDQGFVAGQDQVIVRLQDGTERTMSRADATGKTGSAPKS